MSPHFRPPRLRASPTPIEMRSRVSDAFKVFPTQEWDAFREPFLKAIDALPSDERDAVILVHVLGYKEESEDPEGETAATRCNCDTIRNRLTRAAGKLARYEDFMSQTLNASPHSFRRRSMRFPVTRTFRTPSCWMTLCGVSEFGEEFSRIRHRACGRCAPERARDRSGRGGARIQAWLVPRLAARSAISRTGFTR